VNYLEAYHMAIELVKKAGFELHTVSMRSDTCYYTHPQRRGLLLRLGTHSSKKSPIGLRNVISKATFSRKDIHHFSEKHVRNQVMLAIGRYFIEDPKLSDYQGKRGTWS
jgi:hypothetical protein